MSNIAIIYGYGINHHDPDELEIELPDGVDSISCYSCSAFDPDLSAIGIRVMEDVAMFDPFELKCDITDEQKALVDSIQIPESKLSLFRNKEPKFLVIGYSDD